MDVDLQRQLLINRFGFNPKDILTLTDAKATRQGILTAFEEHLIKQAKPGDVVVYHFSGHGSRVADPDGDTPDGLNSTFVPVDSTSATGTRSQGGVVQDIMGRTLFLLMYALQTENVTAVLDSCYSGGGTRGNLQIRSVRGGSQLQATPAEQEYQQRWLSTLNLSPEEYKRLRRQGVAKGVVIASTKPDQVAADTAFNDVYAGAFTYVMTQYLWQQTRNEALGSAGTSLSAESAQDRALTEATAFAIRIDVAEELTRLDSHLSEIERLLKKGGDIGKRLDFLIQELHREANTLGSKSSSLELTRISVDMKVLIEQMREQVQNIE